MTIRCPRCSLVYLGENDAEACPRCARNGTTSAAEGTSPTLLLFGMVLLFIVGLAVAAWAMDMRGFPFVSSSLVALLAISCGGGIAWRVTPDLASRLDRPLSQTKLPRIGGLRGAVVSLLVHNPTARRIFIASMLAVGCSGIAYGVLEKANHVAGFVAAVAGHRSAPVGRKATMAAQQEK